MMITCYYYRKAATSRGSRQARPKMVQLLRRPHSARLLAAFWLDLCEKRRAVSLPSTTLPSFVRWNQTAVLPPPIPSLESLGARKSTRPRLFGQLWRRGRVQHSEAALRYYRRCVQSGAESPLLTLRHTALGFHEHSECAREESGLGMVKSCLASEGDLAEAWRKLSSALPPALSPLSPG